MNWLDALSSALGVTAGGSAIGGAIYGGAIAIEREMRSEAKKQIAEYLRSRNNAPGSDIVRGLINHAFIITFGEKHFSVSCVIRSITASTFLWIALLLLIYLKYPTYTGAGIRIYTNNFGTLDLFSSVSFIVMLGFIWSYAPDYISLLKGRFFIKWMSLNPTIPKILSLMLADLVGSLLMGFVAAFVLLVPATGLNLSLAWEIIIDGFGIFVGNTPHNGARIILATGILVTLLTSLWSALIMVATISLKAATGLTYLMRTIDWMFDIDSHPIRVIGLVGAIITWVISLMYGLI